MPVKISADGLSIVTTKSEGTANATIPDICKTPFPSPPGPLPLPYPNLAESKDLKGGSTPMTQFDGGSVALFGSYIEKSTGDETGALGGIISGKTGGKAFFLNASGSVFVEGRPVCRKGDFMIMNELNTVSMSGMCQDDVGSVEELEDCEEGELIEFKVVDDSTGKPLPKTRCLIVYPDGKTIKTKTDKDGIVRRKRVKKGDFKVLIDSDKYEAIS